MRLTGNGYEEIEREVIKLFTMLTINKFPLDCFDICEQLNFVVIPYSKMSQIYNYARDRHIVLDHTEHSELAESEANYFAKYALAPPPLIHDLKIGDYLELAEKFDLSHECAYYSMNKYSKWLRYGSPELLKHEILLISLFQPYMI